MHPANKSNKNIKAILRNLQSDSSHPDPYHRYVSVYNIQKILDIVKPVRYVLFEFIMTEIVVVAFKNLSQLIVATSHKGQFEKESNSQIKPAIELYMISDMIIENIEKFSEQVKMQVDKMDQDDDPNNTVSTVTSYSEFSEYLLQNSFSSDHHCRYQSQKVLHALALKFFTQVSKINADHLSVWIMELIQNCNLIVNKQIDDSQLEVLQNKNNDTSKEQSNIISYLTAQMQGINWLASDMQVSLTELINKDLLFNVVEGIKLFNINQNNEQDLIVEDVSRKIIKSLYFKQLYDLLTN